jgi:hypothetical protein
MLRMKLKITCPQVWDQITSAISIHGMKGIKAGSDAQVYVSTTHGGDGDKINVPCLVFADGDAFSSVCSSANLIFNGTSISLNRQNVFWRDWMRTQVACEDAARIYKACGGSTTNSTNDHVSCRQTRTEHLPTKLSESPKTRGSVSAQRTSTP